MMIVSYETFRIHAERFTKDPAAAISSSAMKRATKKRETLTNKALGSAVPPTRHALGTPMQNHLDEFFAWSISATGTLGTPSEFTSTTNVPS